MSKKITSFLMLLLTMFIVTPAMAQNDELNFGGTHITAGDHIGGIPFLVKSLNIPVIYAPRLAAALIRNKFEEMRLTDKLPLIEYDDSHLSVQSGSL